MNPSFLRFLSGWCFTLAALPAMADKVAVPANAPKSFQAECGSCHGAYLPAFLPAASWGLILKGLDRHFGVDATLDDKTATELSAWLQNNAARSGKFSESPPDHRITRSKWFLKEHRRFGSEVWARAAIKTPGNCGACHGQAAQGGFDEDDVRVPK